MSRRIETEVAIAAIAAIAVRRLPTTPTRRRAGYQGLRDLAVPAGLLRQRLPEWRDRGDGLESDLRARGQTSPVSRGSLS